MTNILRNEWEARLAKHGLAERQLGKKEVICQPVAGIPTGIQSHQFDDTFSQQAWHKAGLDEGDLSRYHEVAFILCPRNIPSWALSDNNVRNVLLSLFPRLATIPRQRKRAAQACALIYRYFRMCEPIGAIAQDTQATHIGIKRRIQRIKRKAKALGFAD